MRYLVTVEIAGSNPAATAKFRITMIEIKKISLDDLNDIEVDVIEALENGFAKHGIVIEDALMDKIMDSVNTNLYQFTTGEWENYN
jgi:hypothetical protein